MIMRKLAAGILFFFAAAPWGALADPGTTARAGTLARPAGSQVIPEKFLRRWDPVTFFFDADTGPAKGGPEDRPERWVTLSPEHAGAFNWLNARTLQFRPAEPWPALSRFTFRLRQKSYSLLTLMAERRIRDPT